MVVVARAMWPSAKVWPLNLDGLSFDDKCSRIPAAPSQARLGNEPYVAGDMQVPVDGFVSVEGEQDVIQTRVLTC